jgi:hypothetical protein
MITDDFKRRIGVVPISYSQFVDRNGWWAKDWQYVVSVKVVFNDGYEASLTVEDYKSLPTDQQTLIKHAESSPPR